MRALCHVLRLCLFSGLGEGVTDNVLLRVPMLLSIETNPSTPQLTSASLTASAMLQHPVSVFFAFDSMTGETWAEKYHAIVEPLGQLSLDVNAELFALRPLSAEGESYALHLYNPSATDFATVPWDAFEAGDWTVTSHTEHSLSLLYPDNELSGVKFRSDESTKLFRLDSSAETLVPKDAVQSEPEENTEEIHICPKQIRTFLVKLQAGNTQSDAESEDTPSPATPIVTPVEKPILPADAPVRNEDKPLPVPVEGPDPAAEIPGAVEPIRAEPNKDVPPLPKSLPKPLKPIGYDRDTPSQAESSLTFYVLLLVCVCGCGWLYMRGRGKRRGTMIPMMEVSAKRKDFRND